MKKLTCLLLALLLVAISVPALAVSWSAPTMSATASPFQVEVVKLQVASDVTGGKYYTILPDAAGYTFSKIYYAIKLSLPSYADANAYYGTKDLVSGSTIKVTISYKNIIGKDNDVLAVPLTGSAQTLWYDGTAFTAKWEETAAYPHVLSGTVEKDGASSITACVASRNKLSDILIDGCFTIAEKHFYGAKTCVNCAAVNLNGYLVSGDCSKYGVFIAVNAAKKATAVYVIDRTDPAAQYQGDTLQVDKRLFRWEQTGLTDYCDVHGFRHAKYGFVELMKDTVFGKTGRLTQPAASDGAFPEYCDRYKVKSELRDYGSVYWMDEDSVYHPVTGTEDWWPSAALCHKDSTAYTGTDALAYLDVYYKVDPYSDALLHKMLSAETVDCDSSEKAYLNAANYVMRSLGFTYADIAAGTVYLTEDNILANFGFKANTCNTGTWGAYPAAITVAPVAAVPATGGAPWWVRLLEVLGVS